MSPTSRRGARALAVLTLALAFTFTACSKEKKAGPAPEPPGPTPVAVDAEPAPPTPTPALDAAIGVAPQCKPRFSHCSCSWICVEDTGPGATTDCAKACPDRGPAPGCTVVAGKCAVAR